MFAKRNKVIHWIPSGDNNADSLWVRNRVIGNLFVDGGRNTHEKTYILKVSDKI